MLNDQTVRELVEHIIGAVGSLVEAACVTRNHWGHATLFCDLVICSIDNGDNGPADIATGIRTPRITNDVTCTSESTQVHYGFVAHPPSSEQRSRG